MNHLTPKRALLAAVALVVLLAALGSGHGSKSSSSSISDSSTSAPATAVPEAKAHIVMVRGSSSDNSCQEEPGEARIYVMITVRNTGDADGTVDPWATFDYSDGGNSTEDYYNGYGHDLTVPAHTTVDATFFHTYNAQQHYLLRCTGSRDLHDSSAPSWYMPLR